MTVSLTYDSALSRVRVAASALSVSAVTATVERSTDQISWTTVRGASALTVTGQAASVDDYEFAADVVNYYRVTAYNVSAVQTNQETSSVTPTLGGVWIKSVARPFLNRQVTVVDHSAIERRGRAGVFDVVGRSYPVAVSDVRGSRRWELEVLTETTTEAEDFDLLLASGDVLLIHVPADVDVPGGYVTVGDTNERRTSRKSIRRVFSLACIEVAAPGPDVVGATSNWQTVLTAYPTWQDVLNAHPTWNDLLELIGSPTDVIVP